MTLTLPRSFHFLALLRAAAWVLTATVAVVTLSSTARADEPARLVILVEGSGGETLAAAIGAALPEPWKRVDPNAFAKAAKTRKVGGAKALDALKTKIGYVERLLAATDDVRADAVVVVRVPAAPGKKARSAKVALFGAGNRAAAVDTTVKLGPAAPAKDASAVKAAIAAELAQLVPPPTPGATAAVAKPPPSPTTATPATTTPPAATTPAPAAATPANASSAAGDSSAAAASTAPPASSDGTSARVYTLLDASIGVDFASRHFEFNDAVTSNLRPYDVDFVPQPTVKLELYPLAKSNAGLLRDIGVTAGFHAALGLDSKAPDGTTIATTWSRVDVGLRGRFHLGAGETAPILGVDAGYGRETFAFRDQGLRIQNELPSVGYELLRIGLDARVPVGPVAIVAGAYFLPVLHSGDVGRRIRDQTVAGIEAELGVAIPFAQRFEARAGIDYRRFFYSFGPIPGDAVVAGGALEQLIRGELAAAFVY